MLSAEGWWVPAQHISSFEGKVQTISENETVWWLFTQFKS